MRPITWWRGGVIAAALALAACGGGGGSDRIQVAARPQQPIGADYLTQSDHFAALQEAALTADYAEFANHLRARDPQVVVGQLRDAFAGGPFDVYTLAAQTGGRDHRRVAELRGPSGRLYLYLELDEAAGGWNVARYELTRERSTVLARL